VLHATDLLGGEAYDRDGHFVGQITELFVEPADQPNRVARVLLGRGKYLPLIVRHENIAFVAPGVIRLNVEEKNLEHYEPNGWPCARTCWTNKSSIPAGAKSSASTTLT
jgi:hypothetical protein